MEIALITILARLGEREGGLLAWPQGRALPVRPAEEVHISIRRMDRPRAGPRGRWIDPPGLSSARPGPEAGPLHPVGEMGTYPVLYEGRDTSLFPEDPREAIVYRRAMLMTRFFGRAVAAPS